ncbi:GYF domain-containing protein [Luteolibacter arcticus]|uniref:GYF domain-containing protein n=1 Tax=Luteolibacter arcticus TaxID=1581411 RepID=A0ABT3GIB4_9BACT|nr:GYF domain-containing protein [Luteolibacter arcticus]MCW1923229.1 GYF domain-containing protein [Luteolibacter arcticus]
MNDHYWIQSGSDQKGPYTLSQLQSMWRGGSITADTLYFQEGLEGWEPISLIAETLDPPKPVLSSTPAYQAPAVPQQINSAQPPKNPGVAAVLSFFVPGLGQIYNGQIGIGLVLCILTFALYFTIILGLVLHLHLVYDAYQTATKINTGKA